MTAGRRTSEFWLSALSVVGLFVLAAIGRLDAEVAVGAAAAVTATYTAGRAAVKSTANRVRDGSWPPPPPTASDA